MKPDKREKQPTSRSNAAKVVCDRRDFGPDSIHQLYMQKILAQILVKFPLPERWGAGRGS